MNVNDFRWFRIKAFFMLVAVLFAVAAILYPIGYFGPLSSRIRGLFMKHTKTGNPLVDSVAEHQPANSRMYEAYLNLPLDFVHYGIVVCLLKRNNACYFLAIYGYIAWHFSLKMSRLVLICGPIVAIMCAIWLGFVLDFILEPFKLLLGERRPITHKIQNGSKKGEKDKEEQKAKAKGKPNKGKASSLSEDEWATSEWQEGHRTGGMAALILKFKMAGWDFIPTSAQETIHQVQNTWKGEDASRGTVLTARALFSVFVVYYVLYISDLPKRTTTFLRHCDEVAMSMSNPMVKYKARLQNGREIIVDDHWLGYKWLDQNTPKDSRVMAWWDYGYQITGIGRRATLADGNTWNHEQIATIGKLLSSSVKFSHNITRHLADYVLVWTGGQQDDLGISPHFARIGNSVYPGHCKNPRTKQEDPFCQGYGFRGSKNDPLPMMAKSLVYNLFMHDKNGPVKVDESLFQEVFTSARRYMRIFKVVNASQESKDWVKDPANRICDAPGSWYCVGQYPPAIRWFIDRRESFSQVEDFNKKGRKSKYTEAIEKQRREGKVEI
mmetsp:Transcript_54445/g.84653  ORF Transcript_54445/g.84653 Transcript_54445/m.84653 type:complete len:552 (-) Transcript_54445:92-1747(-)